MRISATSSAVSARGTAVIGSLSCAANIAISAAAALKRKPFATGTYPSAAQVETNAVTRNARTECSVMPGHIEVIASA